MIGTVGAPLLFVMGELRSSSWKCKCEAPALSEAVLWSSTLCECCGVQRVAEPFVLPPSAQTGCLAADMGLVIIASESGSGGGALAGLRATREDEEEPASAVETAAAAAAAFGNEAAGVTSVPKLTWRWKGEVVVSWRLAII